MRAGLASLALFGATARGCSLRGGRPSDETLMGPGMRGLLGNLFVAPPAEGQPIQEQSMIPFVTDEEMVQSMEADKQRRQGKLELREACNKDAKFEECHRSQGRVANALHLERCLSHGPRLSKSCAQGIKQWKTLLADLWHEAHDVNGALIDPIPVEEADFFAAKRIPPVSPLPSRFEFLRNSPEADVIHSDISVDEKQGSGHDLVLLELSSTEPALVNRFEPRDHHPHHDHPHHDHDHHDHGDSHDHGPPGRGPPPSHANGRGPHGRHPHGPPPHELPSHGLQGPHGPPCHHNNDHGDHPRTAFSVLWSWLFEDSLDSSSSSDEFSENSSDLSKDSSDSSEDSSVEDLSEDRAMVIKEERERKEREMTKGAKKATTLLWTDEEKWMEVQPKWMGFHRPGRGSHAAGLLDSLDRGAGVEVNDPRLSDKDENPLVVGILTGGLERAPHQNTKRAFRRHEREHAAQEREVLGREAQGLEPLTAHDRSNTVHNRLHRFPSANEDVHAEFYGGRHHEKLVVPDRKVRGNRHHHEGLSGPDVEFHGGPHHGGSFGSGVDFRTGFHHEGPFREHRQERGDHLRSRNRLPEEYENSEWFVSMDDDEGVVDVVLGFFFLIGSATLLLLPFFLLARTLKRMGRLAGGRSCHGAGGAEGFTARRRAHAANVAAAADGYEALPEDGGELEELAEDDDAVVVTGTPVNPPPSVHL